MDTNNHTNLFENRRNSQTALEMVHFMWEVNPMTITTTELKNNQSKYLSLASREDVFVTKNGKPIAKIVGVQRRAIESIESVFGVLPSDFDEKSVLEERLASL